MRHRLNIELEPFNYREFEGDFESFESEEWDLALEGEVSRTSPDYIRWVQRSLNKIMRLRLAEDGIAGPQTRSAIRSFQQRYGLAVDGVVGPITEAALLRAGAPPISSATPAPAFGMPSTAVPTGTPDIVDVRGIKVASQIAPNIGALLAAAEADGIRLSGSGYRSTASQIELRKKHCGTSHYDIYEKPSGLCTPPTAPPGKSMHEKGLAIDFTYNGQTIKTRDNPGFQWLYYNAANFGLKNFEREPWHWSTNGH